MESWALVEAGILSPPDSPQGAYRRATALLRQGQYQEARALLYPHVRSAPGGLRANIAELLATCAVHLGGDWTSLIDSAFQGRTLPGEKARVYRLLGDAQHQQGAFVMADESYHRCAELYMEAGDRVKAALANCRRARVQLRAGHITAALQRVDRSLDVLLPLKRPRDEGVVRLDRARILASMGQGEASAKEAVWGERLLAASGNQVDRSEARLARAEALWILGESERAVRGLERVLEEVADIDDVETRAWVHTLLGRALISDSISNARRHLMRGKHLYERLRSTFGLATCELWMSQAEHRMGLAVYERLRTLAQHDLSEWPLYEAELKTVRAEVLSQKDPERARRLLFDARQFGVSSGNRSLARRVDNALLQLGLVATEDLEPLDDEATVPTVHTGVTQSAGLVPPGGPQRIDDNSSKPRRRRPRRARAAELVGRPQLGLPASPLSLPQPASMVSSRPT